VRTETDWTVQAGTAGGRGRSDIESKHLLGGLLYQIGDKRQGHWRRAPALPSWSRLHVRMKAHSSSESQLVDCVRIVHFLRNALDYLPRKADDDGLQELRWIYDWRDAQEARQNLSAWLLKWGKRYAKLCAWVEENIEETLSFYRLPRQHHKNLKSTNMLERLMEDVLTPISAACLRTDQWVLPSFGCCCPFRYILACTAGFAVRGLLPLC
jgi:Transposase, Mutator family